MARPVQYRAVFSEGAANFLVAQPKRRQRQIVRFARQLAANPFVLGDYLVSDDSGRELSQLLIGDFVFSYWIDHAAVEVRIVEIEDAS